MGEEMGQPRGDPRALTEKILRQAVAKKPELGRVEGAKAQPWVFGGTKVFMRGEDMMQYLEQEREQVLGAIRKRLLELKLEQERKRQEAEAKAKAEAEARTRMEAEAAAAEGRPA